MRFNTAFTFYILNHDWLIDWGWLQDKHVSEQSICEGLPVVSFSIGDTAEFLYGDEREVDKAKRVLLESGDVLIFGGKSWNIFHGITAIHPYTSPSRLVEETNLRKPGRLILLSISWFSFVVKVLNSTTTLPLNQHRSSRR